VVGPDAVPFEAVRLLEVPEGGKQRVGELDRLRGGVFKSSSKGWSPILRLRYPTRYRMPVDSISEAL
jgi:hypothetical protein